MKRLNIIALAAAFISMLSATTTSAQNTCSVVVDSVSSDILGMKRAYTVVLPRGYNENTDKKYPVLYLLHGMYGINEDWVKLGNVKLVNDILTASGQMKEMIIITPDAGGVNPKERQNGYFNLKGYRYEDFFFEEFLPAVESRYRVAPGRRNRAIAGLSMGGGCTISYAQRHPDLFGSAYAMSAWVGLSEPQIANFKYDENDLIVKLQASVNEHDGRVYVRNASEKQVEELKSVKWFFDCGDDDFLIDVNIDLYREMRAKRIPCEFRMRDGGHNWEYWHTALYSLFPWVSLIFE